MCDKLGKLHKFNKLKKFNKLDKLDKPDKLGKFTSSPTKLNLYYHLL